MKITMLYNSKEIKRPYPYYEVYIPTFLHKYHLQEECQKRLDEIPEGTVIYDRNGKRPYVFNRKYEWKFAHSEETLAHMQIPPYLAVNELGEVISFAYGNRPVCLVPEPNKDGYLIYHFRLPNGQVKRMAAHNLSSLAFGGYTSDEEVLYLLNTKGLSVFGTRLNNVNGHHKDGDKTNNHYSNIEFQLKDPHSKMHSQKYEELIDTIALPTVIETPYSYDPHGTFLRYTAWNSMTNLTTPEALQRYKNSIIPTEALR